MRSSKTSGLAATLVFAVAGPALGQVAQRPDVRVGDEWRFAVYYAVRTTEPSRTWSITSVNASGIDGTENGEPLRLTRDLDVLDSPRSAYTDPQWLRFPLEVGQRWRFRTDWHFKPKGSKGSSHVDVEVAAYEKVVVPAGEFDAFRLMSRATLDGTSPIGSRYGGDSTTTYWYAPAARAIVKSVNHNPYLGVTNVELVSFRRAP